MKRKDVGGNRSKKEGEREEVKEETRVKKKKKITKV